MQQYEAKIETQSIGSLKGTCDNCPKINTSSSSTGGLSNAETLIGVIGQLHDLQKDVRKLQEDSKKTFSFYDTTSKLNKTVRIVVIILMIIPIIQLLCCAGVVYSLGIEEKLPGLLKWTLGGVTFLSFTELIIGGVKLFLYEKRMDNLEKKINEIPGE